MKKYLYLLSTVSAAFIIGCGSNSSVSDQKFSYNTSSIFGYSQAITYKNYVVNAVDDPIIGATVTATNCQSYKDLGNGQYMLEKCIAKPLYIEIKNGIILKKDANGKDINVSQNFPLLLNVSQSQEDGDFMVTPLTTIIANANENNITALAKKLGVSKEDLFSSDNNVKKLLPKVNAILIASAAQGAITNKIKFLDTVREAIIDNSSNGDINISNIINTVQKKSTSNPNFFGLVIVPKNNINNEDPLQSLSKIQNAKNVTFYGLVFDKAIADANITIKDLNTNKIYSDLNTTTNTYGAWNISIDKNETKGSLYYTIANEDHLLQLTATKKDGNKTIKLTSTIMTTKLKKMLNDGSNIISPTKDNSLIVSNVTTAQDAILSKKGALNSKSYESNLTNLRIYNQDRVIKVAAIIKAVVDNNASTKKDYNNTYNLAKDSISINNNGTINDINTSVVDTNVSEIEQNITNNTILSSQLNNTENKQQKNNPFQQMAKNTGYTFYRLLAYYKKNKPHTDENFIREYSKIIVYPGHYETKTCYLDGNSTDNWNCDNPKIIKDKSNFTLGYYQVNENNNIIKYSLDFNNSVYVPNLNKTYTYYGVIKSNTNLNSGITKTEPMVLVNSYDVVDAFRRIPSKYPNDFKELQQDLNNSNGRTEANFAINRWIKQYMSKIQNYFNKNQSN